MTFDYDDLFDQEKQRKQLQELENKFWNESVENRTCFSCKYYKLKKEWEMGYETTYGLCNFGGKITYLPKSCLFYELDEEKDKMDRIL